jgi:hypothetical protein
MRFTGVASMAALAAVLLPACGAIPLGNVSTFTSTMLAAHLNNIYTESSVSGRTPREALLWYQLSASRAWRVP